MVDMLTASSPKFHCHMRHMSPSSGLSSMDFHKNITNRYYFSYPINLNAWQSCLHCSKVLSHIVPLTKYGTRLWVYTSLSFFVFQLQYPQTENFTFLSSFSDHNFLTVFQSWSSFSIQSCSLFWDYFYKILPLVWDFIMLLWIWDYLWLIIVLRF